MKKSMLVAIAALMLASAAIAQPTATIEWIDPADHPYGTPMAITNDGNKMVGQDYFQGNSFVWTRGEGMTTIPGTAYDIADNGTIVGEHYMPFDGWTEPVRQAAYYTEDTGWVALDGFPNQPPNADWFTHAYSISRQTGEKIVGMLWINAGDVVAYEWTFADGFNLLPSDIGESSYKAMYQSGDGSVVAGWDQQWNGCRVAYKWDPDPVFLGTLCDDPTWPHGEPQGVSDNGTYITGASITGLEGTEAFIYDDDRGMLLVGMLPDHYSSYGMAVSDDGNVVGWSQDDWGPWGTQYGFYWNENTGIMTLADYLTDLGADIPDGYHIERAVDMSADGRYILGSAVDDQFNFHWFIAEIDNGDPEPVSVTLTPANTVIPEAGGTLTYDVHLLSTIGAAYNNVQFWTDVILPNGTTYGPLFTYTFNLVPFMDHTATGLTQQIPGYAPAGTYTFQGHVGYPNGPSIMDSFGFTKEGATVNATSTDPTSWANGGGSWLAEEGASDLRAIPNSFAISQITPNPFNPSTEITVTLPETAELQVTVYNVSGQQVASLAQGQFTAGQHRFSFDGSALASGLYFVRAQVPGQHFAVQKMTLMK